jgi:hypothetical protein
MNMPKLAALAICCLSLTLRTQDKGIPLSFDQQKQFALEALRFLDGSTWKEASLDKGKIFWAPYPVELAEDLAPAAELYKYVAATLKI